MNRSDGELMLKFRRHKHGNFPFSSKPAGSYCMKLSNFRVGESKMFLQTFNPMSGHAMSQQSCSFTRSNWSWDLLIDLICMQRETSGTNRGEKVNVMLIFYPSESASSCAHCTLTICGSYRNHMTHNYCKGSSSFSGCELWDVIKMYLVNL